MFENQALFSFARDAAFKWRNIENSEEEEEDQHENQNLKESLSTLLQKTIENRNELESSKPTGPTPIHVSSPALMQLQAYLSSLFVIDRILEFDENKGFKLAKTPHAE